MKQKNPLQRAPYNILSCPLFQHMKHTDACTVLRAKGVCRVNCEGYFSFAKENKPAIEIIIKKHEKAIQHYREKHELKPEADLVAVVMPKGDYICEYCSKPFKTAGRLTGHLKRKHRRETARSGTPVVDLPR